MAAPGSLPLAEWESFYVIVGSSAAALTGLQFVVVVLSAEARVGSAHTTRAFGTPTVVHFCAVLLVSAVLSAPWHTLSTPSLALGACGLAGLIYGAVVLSHLRRQTDYVPVIEDWIWYAVLPLVAYAGLVASAIELRAHSVPSLFLAGATALLLLFIGIHNAWDAVTYIAHGRRSSEEQRP